MKEAAATPLVHERTDHGRLTKVVLICNRLARLGLTIFKQSQRSRLLEDRPLAFTAGSHKSKKYSYQQIDRSPTLMRQVGQKKRGLGGYDSLPISVDLHSLDYFARCESVRDTCNLDFHRVTRLSVRNEDNKA